VEVDERFYELMADLMVCPSGTSTGSTYAALLSKADEQARKLIPDLHLPPPKRYERETNYIDRGISCYTSWNNRPKDLDCSVRLHIRIN